MPVRFRLAIGAPQSPLSRWIALSLLGHVVATVVWIGMTRRMAPRRPPMPESIAVVLSAGPRAAKSPATGTPGRVAVPAPSPLPPPPKPNRPRPTPPAPKKPVAPPAKKTPPSSRAASQAVPTVKEPLPGEASESGSPGPSSGAAGDGASVSAIDLGGNELAWYRDAVSGRLFQTWRQPLLDAVRDALEVQIRFAIAADGHVRDPRIERSSGVPSLDRSALRAVTEASPLPPLPRGWRDSPIEASFVFRLFPEDR